MAGLDDLARDWNDRVNRFQAALVALSQSYAGRGEADMKRDRPWQDRTGNARNRLFGRAIQEGGGTRGAFTVGFVLGHGMEYGLFLELGTRYMRIPPADASSSGRPSVVPATGLVGYPIVVPTLDRLAPQFVDDARQLLGRA